MGYVQAGGSVTVVGRKQVHDWFNNLLSKISKVSSTISGPVVVRHRVRHTTATGFAHCERQICSPLNSRVPLQATSYATVLYGITKKNCAFAFEFVHYSLHAEDGTFSRYMFVHANCATNLT